MSNIDINTLTKEERQSLLEQLANERNEERKQAIREKVNAAGNSTKTFLQKSGLYGWKSIKATLGTVGGAAIGTVKGTVRGAMDGAKKGWGREETPHTEQQ